MSIKNKKEIKKAFKKMFKLIENDCVTGGMYISLIEMQDFATSGSYIIQIITKKDNE